MVNLFLDAYSLACPRVSEGAEAATRFIFGLVGWQELFQAEWISIYLSEHTYSLLVEEGLYPADSRIREIIAQHGLNVQVRDVVVLINSLLNRAPSFEERFGIGSVTANQERYITTMLNDGRSQAFSDALRRLLLWVAIAEYFGRLSRKEIFLVGRLNGVEFEDVRIEANTDVCILRPDELKFGCQIDCVIRACATLVALYSGLDPVRMWVMAGSDEEYRQSLRIALVQRGADVAEVASETSVYRVNFGTEFLRSVTSLRFQADEGRARRLIRACCDTILNESCNATHALRDGRGGNNSQVTRGADAAWRRDIDYEFHLHYWATSAGPEFASVVVHNDFSIPS